MLTEAVKLSVILVILDWLRISSNTAWFEEHCDFASVQAVLLNGKASTWWQQTKVLVKLQSRVSDE